MRSRSFATVGLIRLVLPCSASGSSLVASTAVSSGAGQATPVLSTGSPSSATVAGTIRHNGSPVSDVQVFVTWEGGEQSVTTGADGGHGASGIPTGGPVSVCVRPPVEQRSAFCNWRTEALSGDLVKDFDLGPGRRLQGEVRTPDGTAYPPAPSFRAMTLDFSLPEGEWLEVAAGGGSDVHRWWLPFSRSRAWPVPLGAAPAGAHRNGAGSARCDRSRWVHHGPARGQSRQAGSALAPRTGLRAGVGRTSRASEPADSELHGWRDRR
jgi:hypothetical protein